MHQLLETVYGQSKNLKLLYRIYQSDKIPHAFLFSGPEGVGKFNTALQFIKLLNISNNQLIDQRTFKHIDSFREPYVKLILPLPRGKGEKSDSSSMNKLPEKVIKEINDEINKKSGNPYYKINIDKANNIKINSIREVKKNISLNFDDVKYRAILMNRAESMSLESQNALLKSLEEPPQGVIFFFID